jgi:hypothetical protein
MDAGVDAGVPMGTNCGNALSVAIGDSPTGKIDVAGKKVFYKFTAGAGQWLDISTTANAMDNSNTLDTAITLFDATGATKLASDDDAYPRASTDSELYYRVVTAGTYCLSIEDWSTWAGETAVLPATNTYKIDFRGMVATATTNNLDTEPNDMTSAPQTGKYASGMGFALGILYGDIGTATDVDTYKFTVPAGLDSLTISLDPLNVPGAAAGSNGYGSTMGRVSVKVMQTNGTVLGAWTSAPASYATMPDNINVPVVPGSDLLVSVERPAGATPECTGTSCNDFYVSTILFGTDNPLEMSDATNGTLAGAEVLAETVDTANAKIKRAFVLGTIIPSDTDYYSVAVTTNDKVSVACGALRTGAGLTATYELEDAAGVALQNETETLAADVYWGSGTGATHPAITATATGNLIFKVTGVQDATNTGNWYRCGIVITSP